MATDSPSRLLLSIRDLCSFGVYKRTQGRRMRQLTTFGILGLCGWGLFQLYNELSDGADVWTAIAVPGVLGCAVGWSVFRLVWGWPRFSDFLIATEAEMAKVSWSKREELKQATFVVLVLVALIAFYLVCVDMAWSWLLRQIGVLLPMDAAEPAQAAATSMMQQMSRTAAEVLRG